MVGRVGTRRGRLLCRRHRGRGQTPHPTSDTQRGRWRQRIEQEVGWPCALGSAALLVHRDVHSELLDQLRGDILPRAGGVGLGGANGCLVQLHMRPGLAFVCLICYSVRLNSVAEAFEPFRMWLSLHIRPSGLWFASRLGRSILAQSLSAGDLHKFSFGFTVSRNPPRFGQIGSRSP